MREPPWTTSPVWTAVGWTMLHTVWVGAAVGLAGAASRRLMRPAGPGARYGVALALLAALSASPAAIFALVLEPDARPASAPASPAADGHPAVPAVPAYERSTAPDLSPPPPGLRAGAIRQTGADTLVALLPAVWLAGTLSTVAAIGTGLIGVEQLRRSSRAVRTGGVARSCRVLADSLGIARRVGVAVCDRLDAPVLIGIVRPLILLPPAALTGWSVEQLEMALLHELAHLRRWDNLVNLGQRVAESLLFFHPAAWWLSGWVRLERELCCDRLVVGRTGRPCDYAAMLVALSGPGGRGRRVALAMAEHQVVTRVRRLLNLEDRSMRLTMPEGLGLLAAAAVGAALAVGAHAAPPDRGRGPGEPARLALRQAAEAAGAVRQAGTGRGDPRGHALVAIAEAQLKLGDRDEALANLRRAFAAIDGLDPKGMDWEALANLTVVARRQREAGDVTAARTSLGRVADVVGALEPGPTPEEIVQVTGTDEPRRKIYDVGAVHLSEILTRLAEERAALGDTGEGRALARRAAAAIGPQEGPLQAIVLSTIASRMLRTGDAAGARDLVGLARHAAEGLPTPQDRNGAMPYVAAAAAETGDLDGALAMAWALEEPGSLAALDHIIEAFATVDEHHAAWFDPGGIKITVGAGLLTPKDPAAARRDLPAVARSVIGHGTPALQSRVLSKVAHLQAKAGDLAGALGTARAIPGVKRKAGPATGFPEAERPATFAALAALQAGAGDKVGAAETFRRAEALARAVESDLDAVVARLLIARARVEAGDDGAARDLLAETVPIALRQPEPRRSRSLAMLCEGQAKAGDPAAAATTAEAVRGYPGLEKVRAFTALADWHEGSGDKATADRFLRRVLSVSEAKPPAEPKLGQVRPLPAIGARTFVDPDFEYQPQWVAISLESNPVTLRARLGDTEGALGAARALPEGSRGRASRQLAGQLARRGDVAAAVALAATLETADDRLAALVLTVQAVKDRPEAR